MTLKSVGLVVVTYNRCALLKRCLEAIANQCYMPETVLIIDNASTDDTYEWLCSWLPRNLPIGQPIQLRENLGGAGGFAIGLQAALRMGTNWVWIMDDDAEPHPTALAELTKIADDPHNVYGSLATNGSDTSWTTTLLEPHPHVVEKVTEVPNRARVQSLPFLGFMIHRNLVQKIGLPDAGYFIAADDIEYCIRAERSGAQLIVAGQSRIEHPKSRPYKIKLLGYTLTALELPPWKRYYDTRNRLLIARKYYGAKFYTQTIPGSFVRMAAALVKEPHRIAQLKAFFAGMVDGLLGIKGRRHAKWNIRQ